MDGGNPSTEVDIYGTFTATQTIYASGSIKLAI